MLGSELRTAPPPRVVFTASWPRRKLRCADALAVGAKMSFSDVNAAADAAAKRDSSFRMGQIFGRSDGTVSGDLGVALRPTPVRFTESSSPAGERPTYEPERVPHSLPQRGWFAIWRPSQATRVKFAAVGAAAGAIYAWQWLHAASSTIAVWAAVGAVSGLVTLLAMAVVVWLAKVALAIAVALVAVAVVVGGIAAWNKVGDTKPTPNQKSVTPKKTAAPIKFDL